VVGINNIHAWMKTGTNEGERAIGPYGFMPSTIKDLVSKDKNLKAKYSAILNIPFGDYKQKELEKFVNTHPKINEDLADFYIDEVIRITGDNSIEGISQAWLYGPYAYKRQKKNATANNPTGIPKGDKVTADRNTNASLAYRNLPWGQKND